MEAGRRRGQEAPNVLGPGEVAMRLEQLSGHHRATLQKIFRHPAGNVEWHQVRSLLEAIGATTEEHNGKVKVALGGETEVFQPPRTKDVDVSTIVELRRMLARAGFQAGGTP